MYGEDSVRGPGHDLVRVSCWGPHGARAARVLAHVLVVHGSVEDC
ncbi:hypothetical protein SFR_5419 [Streptomyces sp. FR-008]|nr:hypothetical protein SFR_5419 [Streptomyces sp. FR-008]